MAALATWVGSLSFVVPLWQASAQHSEQLDAARDMHTEGMAQALRLHHETVELAKVQHRESYRQAQKLHDHQMKHDLELSRREALRDLWGQKTQKIQTLMIVSTLMFSCCFAILVEGIPPNETPTWAMVVYSVSVSVSLGSLFLSVWFAMLVQSRMAQYRLHHPQQVYKCGATHTSFHNYYKCHCAPVTKISNHLFYLGAVAVVVAACILIFFRLFYSFNNKAGAWIFVGVCIVSGVMIILGRIAYPSNTTVPSLDNVQNELPDSFMGMQISGVQPAQQQRATTRRRRRHVTATVQQATPTASQARARTRSGSLYSIEEPGVSSADDQLTIDSQAKDNGSSCSSGSMEDDRPQRQDTTEIEPASPISPATSRIYRVV